ncbi:MAG: Gfo/Idh/MocA family oxidoreductase [Opitutaceae bacterium]|jgi:predicted dehydrogenase|nr:Gfo/Idh/MocA family oxidoreductase [Opitutaceae bacterium]
MTKHTYTAAVVGGGSGGGLSMEALTASPRFKLLAAADLREDVRQKLARQYPGIRTYATHVEMFHECPTDVVTVSTFPPSHEKITLAALDRLPLKGILVEKPLGHTWASGRRILQAIQKRNLPVAVPHGLLARRTPLEIINRVKQGETGDLKLLEIQCSGWDIINAGIHWLNFFVNLTGLEPIDTVLAACDSTTRTWRDGMQVETTAVTTAQTRSGIRVTMHTGDHIAVNAPPHQTVFRIFGTRGQIEFYGWETAYHIVSPKHPNGIVCDPPEMSDSGHRYHFERLAEQMDSGAANYDVATSSLMALELCEAACLSSHCRAEVKLPLDTFTPPPPANWIPGQPYSGTGGGRDGRNL